MKKNGLIGIVVALVLVAGALMAVAQDANRTISRLGVEEVYNPWGGSIFISDNVALTGTLTVTGAVTATTMNATLTNLVASGNVRAESFSVGITNGATTSVAIPGSGWTNTFYFIKGMFYTNILVGTP